ncbi:GCN5-like N-acetyltransferase [Powellomyces hirtus]|nr:GCN5-like N-acetyltransferase [Powellomyces hirtus]
MLSNNYTVRRMKPSELAFAMSLAQAESWNPGLHDAIYFPSADASGFFVGVLNDVPIACISAMRYDDSFGFIGLYIVAHEHRGKGYGYGLWKAALANLDGCRMIGLDGVVEQQANYEKEGFVGVYRHMRYMGLIFPRPEKEHNEKVVPLDTVDEEKLFRFDARFFPTARPTFLKAWTRNMKGSHGVAVVQDGQLRAYGVMRECVTGYRIGPLFADDEQAAKTVLLHLVNKRRDKTQPVFMDVPDINDNAVRMVQELDMQNVFECKRMYKGGEPRTQVAGVYGVTLLELG